MWLSRKILEYRSGIVWDPQVTVSLCDGVGEIAGPELIERHPFLPLLIVVLKASSRYVGFATTPAGVVVST